MIRPALLLLAAAFASCSATPDAEMLATVGIVDYGEPRGDEFVFGLSRIDQRFRLDPDAVLNFDGLFKALQASIDTGRSLRVVYDARSGRFESKGTLPSYDVRRIEYDGVTFEVRRLLWSGIGATKADESALASGLAYYSSGSPAQALPALEEALAATGLRQPLQALALKVHGNAIADSVWEVHEAADDADDWQLVRALDDYRRWLALEPGNHEAEMAIGLALRDLGAYDEAVAIFQNLIPEWPEQRIRLVTRIGATYRIMGDYPRSLATLDEFAAGEEPPLGMMFHFHRGWILNLMGRHEEALRDFNEGLETQPDFSGAFDRRACAYAQLGRLEEALADRRRADELDATFFADARATPALEHNRDWAKKVAAVLEAAIAAGNKAPNAAPCDGIWKYGEVNRTRSRRLPDSGVGDSPAFNAN